MRSIVAVGVAFLALDLVAVAGEIEGKKLIGVWELSKAEGQEETPHWRIEFTKDSKLRMTSNWEDKLFEVEGTYTLEKDQLKLTADVDGKATVTNTVTIQELTDDVLVVLDDKKKMKFKRSK
jgi:uncharacterized protein (TIGR03066 family)